jgi:nucleoside diphosphate kinase
MTSNGTDLALFISGPMVALALRKENAIREWRSLAGPTDASVAKRTHPNTLVTITK